MCISCASTELVFFRIYTEERLKPAEFLGFILLRKMAFFFSESPALQSVSSGSYVYFWKKVHLHKINVCAHVLQDFIRYIFLLEAFCYRIEAVKP